MFAFFMVIRRHALLALALSAVGLSFVLPGAPAAHAATTWTVQSAADGGAGNAANCPGAACRLRDALAAAASGDTIDFASDMNIQVASPQLQISSKDLTIDGSGHNVALYGAVNSCTTFSCYEILDVILSSVTLKHLTFSHGGDDSGFPDVPVRDGGAIVVGNDSIVNITDCFFANNAGRKGGAIANNGTLNVTNTTFSGNRASEGGGAIHNQGTLNATGCTFAGNSRVVLVPPLDAYGGAIYSSGTATVANSTFVGNSLARDIYVADMHGGGIYSSGTLHLTNSTFKSNEAAVGGGIYLASANAYVRNNTFQQNLADYVTGVGDNVYLLSAQAFANNILIGEGCNWNFNPMGSGNNLADDAARCGAGFTESSAILLGALGNYGGPTQTIPLLPGSSAIDAGNAAVCAASPVNNLDQRGVARPQGGQCDVGAFESRGFTLGSPTGTPQRTAIDTAFPIPLGLTVSGTDGDPVNGGWVTFTAPASGASLAGTNPMAAPIANGAVSTTVTANGTVGGPYTVTASANGTSASFSLRNTAAGTNTATTLVSTPNPVLPGAAVLFTATVTGSGTPTGTIAFQNNGTDIPGCSAQPVNASGEATCSTSDLAIGVHPIIAVYSGDATFNPSLSPAYQQTVKYDTTTSVAAAPNPSYGREAVVFTATVTATTGTPTGTVTFYDNGAAIGSGTLNASGQATMTTSDLVAGVHPITATYGGDGSYNGSTAPAYEQTVNQASTTTSLVSTPNPSVAGHGIVFTATVTSDYGTPTGAVAFKNDGTDIPECSAQALSGSGQATCSTSTFAAGTYPNITAVYAGTANFSGSASDLYEQTVSACIPALVTNSNDSGEGSLREALGNGCIAFSDDMTITLASELNIAQDVTIDGAGHRIIVSGNNAVPVFYINPGITLNLLNLTVANGKRAGYGGGIQNWQGTLNVTNCTLSGNQATRGGAIYTYDGTVTVANSTFFGNSVEYNGGGIFQNGSGTLTVTNSTFAGNSSGFSGSSVGRAAGTATFFNTLLADNNSRDNCTSDIGNGANNLSDDPSCGTFTWSSSILLGTPGDYGGYTQTVPLLPGSSAIDAGNAAVCAASPVNNLDQRGVARPQGGQCDIGAFESRGFTLGPPTGTPQRTAIDTAFPIPLGLTVSGTAGDPVDGGRVTFTAPASGASLAGTNPKAVPIANGAVSTTATANGTVGGPYTVTASANGTSASFSLTNSAAGTNTTTALASAPNPALPGAAVLFTATVTGSGMPTGTVAFQNNGTDIPGCSAQPVNASGQATCSTSGLAIGVHPNLIAVYGGDATFNPSLSPAYQQAVKYDTTTSLAAAPNPSIAGQGIVFTATVSTTNGGTPTGAVAFKNDGTDIPGCSAQALDGSGQATCSTSALSTGTYPNITAVYAGNANFSGSASDAYSQTVADCLNAITVATNADSGAGSLRQAIADVCAGGTITFNDDHTVVLTSELTLGKNLTIDGTGHSVTISGNHVTRVFNISGGTITMNQLTIADGNSGGADGGGIYVAGGTLTVTNSTFSGNVSNWPGGRAVELRGGTAKISSSTFIGNSAISGGYGGAINTFTGTTLNVTNCTFSGNSAASAGGAISVTGTGNIINSTISGNSSGWAGGGGGINNEAGTITVKNSIIANNPTGGNCFNHYSGYPFSGSSSLVDDSSCSAGFTNSASIRLGALDNYGGVTQTFPLLPGSAAIDAGDSATCAAPATVNNLDQRGVARPQGTVCDIGAFESRGFTLAKTGGDNQSTVLNTAFANPLALSVAPVSAGEPVDGGVITFTAPASGASTNPATTTATIAAGAASQSVAANGTAGLYSVAASASGAVGVNYNLTNNTPSTDLSITVTDGVTTATPGGSTTYTITAANTGPSNAPGATVADIFPASLTCTWTCVGAGGGTCTASGSGNINDTANLPAGGSVTYTASCTVSASATGTLSNTATVAAPGGVTDPVPGNNSATDNDILARQGDLAITVTDGVTTATPGGSTTYTITAANAGPSNAPGATVADIFPASLTCTWTCVGAGGGTCTASGSGNINDTVNLPSGGSVTYTASCTISASATGTLSNTATVAAPGGVTDPVPGNNSATDSDTLARQGDLAITVTDGVTTATPGGSTTYTITAANTGPSNATGSTVGDIFPASLTCIWTCVGAGGGTCTASGSGNINGTVNLPAGGSVTYTASCTISPSVTGTLSNTATIAAPGGVTDPVPGNNSATDSDTLTSEADLSITKSDTPDPVFAGQDLTYTLNLANSGPSDAQTVTVTDAIPANTTFVSAMVTSGSGWSTSAPAVGGSGTVVFSKGAVAAGESATMQIVVKVNSAIAGGTVISNTATAASTTTDANPGNNSAGASSTVAPAVIYAGEGGLTSGFCGSWATACELRYALANAIAGQEIRVAQGVYKPTDDTSDRGASFALKSGVKLSGGYAGPAEADPDARDIAVNVTILSGDIDNNDSQTPVITDLATVTGNATNSYHVVTASGVDATAILDGFTVTGGNAEGGNGGGIYVASGSPTVSACTISGNRADWGGGIFNNGNLDLTASTVSGNTAAGGGGIYNEFHNPGSTVLFKLSNSTLSGNRASWGGALYDNGGYATTNITNCTFSGNQASEYGGILGYTETATYINTIIANNTGGNCSIYEAAAGSANNLADDASCGNTFTNSASILLGALGNYGGVNRTMPLLPGSVAIDAATSDCPATDQRGLARPQGANCDIGAFESQGFILGSLTGTPQSAVISTPFATPLGLTVTATNAVEPVDGGAIIFTPPASGAGISATAPFVATVTGGAVSQNVTANGATGSYTVTATAAGATGVSFDLTNGIAPAFTSADNTTFTYGSAGTFAVTASGDPAPTFATASTLPAGVTLASYGTLSGTPTEAGAFPLTISAGNLVGTAGQSFTITVNKATASVSLGALNPIYDGTPKAVTVSTDPADKTVVITYNGTATAPTNAGSYTVVATVVDDNYQGSASGTLTIAKSAATVTFGNLSHPYDGTPKAATASTSPTGLTVTFTYDGSSTLPVAVGSYAVVATVVAANYQGSASGTLEILDTIAPALALSTLADGTTTNAALLNVAGSASDAESGLAGLTVNGSATAVGANGSFSAAVVLTPGANTLTVVATDNAGNESSETRIIHLDRTTPGVTVTLPDNSATGTDTLEVGGTLDDPQGVVTVSVNGGTPLPAQRSGKDFSLVLTLPPGVNTIEIVVTDPAGNRTVVKRTITVDLTAPELAITDPAADSTVRALPLTLRGSVADALSEVILHLIVDDATVTPTVAGSTFSYELSASQGGSFRIEATATDLLGNSATAVRNLLYDPYGDADGNGLVEVADALIVLKMAVGQEIPDLHFDVAPLIDGMPHPDGKINVADALVILRRALGLVNW